MRLDSLLFLSLIIVTTSACLTDGALKGLSTQEDSSPPEAFSGLSFRNTRLNGLFSRYPYDTTKPFDQQFPRVALTVIDAPQGRTLYMTGSSKVCWKLRAKIWLSPSVSQNVESFHWCKPDDVAADVPLEGANGWFASFTAGTHTGNTRTDGFVPPDRPVPYDLRHQKLWGTAAGLNANMQDGKMLASLLYFMGFDWSYTADHRVWVTEFIQAY